MSFEKRKKDWVGIYKGKDKEICPRCGGNIMPESYVGITPEGELYCKKCVTEEVMHQQKEEDVSVENKNKDKMYI